MNQCHAPLKIPRLSERPAVVYCQRSLIPHWWHRYRSITPEGHMVNIRWRYTGVKGVM